jgi:hypothetical protein
MLISERHVMSWNKRLTAFFIPLLLVSTFVAVFHFHADVADHHECPICVVSHHQPATGQSAATYEVVPCFIESTIVVTSQHFTDDLFFTSHNNRAPPA